MKVLKDNSLTLALMAIFLVSIVGQALTGWHTENEEQIRHGAETVAFGSYLVSGEFLSAVFENWESEFLQMGGYVFLTAWLYQRGSAESRDPDGPDEDAEAEASTPEADKPRLARAHGLARKLYDNSLGLTLMAMFVICFVLHWINSARMGADEARLHGEIPPSLLDRLGEAEFWFESFQNWQSEFLSVAVLVVLSIFLRQKNSPESKPVAAPHSATGA